MSIPGTNALLMGGTGVGKTYCIRTLIEAGITPFVLFTENGMRTLSDVPEDKLHWKYIPSATPSWATMKDSARKINTMDMKALSGLSDISKKNFTEFYNILDCMNDFVCDRTGEHFGNVSEWNTDRAIVIDSLSGLSEIGMNLVVGSKPMKSQADWGIAMDNLERFNTKMCLDTQCHFIMTAHAERETDELTGGTTIMPSTLGRKLAPKIPRYYDDVILCERKGTNFTWSTAANNVDLKARNLPIATNQEPSFVPIIDAWKKSGGSIQPTVTEEKPVKLKNAT